jgi:hypothetical protein
LVLDQTPFSKLYHNTNYGNINDKWFVVKKMEGLSTVVDQFSGAVTIGAGDAPSRAVFHRAMHSSRY